MVSWSLFPLPHGGPKTEALRKPRNVRVRAGWFRLPQLAATRVRSLERTAARQQDGN